MGGSTLHYYTSYCDNFFLKMMTKLIYVYRNDKNKKSYWMHQKKELTFHANFFLNELYFMDELLFHLDGFKSTSFIKMDVKKIWNVNSKPFNLLSICWNLI